MRRSCHGAMAPIASSSEHRRSLWALAVVEYGLHDLDAGLGVERLGCAYVRQFDQAIIAQAGESCFLSDWTGVNSSLRGGFSCSVDGLQQFSRLHTRLLWFRIRTMIDAARLETRAT